MTENNYENEGLEDWKEKTTKFHEALFSDPIDNYSIIDILCSTTNEARQHMRGLYKSSYNTPIQNDIKSQLKDKLQQISIDMFDTPYEYDARELHSALNSLTNDDSVIIEIFASKPSVHLQMVDEAYKLFFNTSLTDEITKHIGGIYGDFLITLMNTERPNDQTISGGDAYEAADLLTNGGLANIGVNVEQFKEIFVEKSREDLILISRAYYERTQKSLYDAIDEEIEGKNKELLKGIIFAVITPAQWFARKISEVKQGLGGDDNTIRRILISRAEIDIDGIRDYYLMETNNELRNDVYDKNNELYSQILINLSAK